MPRPTARPSGWRSVHPDVRVVRLERNGGFCAAANAGIAAARGRFIQLLNNDTEVTAGWIEAGLAPFADPTVGSVAPLVLVRSDPAGSIRPAIPTPWSAGRPSEDTASPPRSLPRGRSKKSSAPADRARSIGPRPCGSVGGFDPLFGSYYEDIDLAFRLRWAGYRCLFAPRCVIHHDVSATYDHGSPALQRRMARNAELVFWSNMPFRLVLRDPSAPWVPGIAGTLAAGQGQTGAVSSGKARCRPCLARDPLAAPAAFRAGPKRPSSSAFPPGYGVMARCAESLETAGGNIQ